MPPVAAASVVFMATCAAKAPSLPDFMVNVEPGLKPYQPNLTKKIGKRGNKNRNSQPNLKEKHPRWGWYSSTSTRAYQAINK